MKYEEAIQKSLSTKWVIGTCSEGEKCWCRTVSCEPHIMFKDSDGSEHEYWPIRSGEVGRETVEHIVKLHNDKIEKL